MTRQSDNPAYGEFANMLGLRLYAVSSGDGNAGVSHMFPDYYVWTSDPWRLAELALVDLFKDEYKEQAAAEFEIDGQSDDCIFAILYDPLDRENEDEDYESGPAELIIEVFPSELPDTFATVYENPEACFTDKALTLVPASRH